MWERPMVGVKGYILHSSIILVKNADLQITPTWGTQVLHLQ